MNDDVIVPIFVVIDEVMTILGHRSHPQSGASDSDTAQRAPAPSPSSPPASSRIITNVP